jgi:hypothetical protein
MNARFDQVLHENSSQNKLLTRHTGQVLAHEASGVRSLARSYKKPLPSWTVQDSKPHILTNMALGVNGRDSGFFCQVGGCEALRAIFATPQHYILECDRAGRLGGDR